MFQSFVSGDNFISVPLLTPENRIDVLDHWFQINNRKLTDEQRSYVLSMFEKCSLPLYIKLCFREAITWTSFRPIEECQLEDTIRGCIDKLFKSLENKHGELFVVRALGYVTVGNENDDITFIKSYIIIDKTLQVNGTTLINATTWIN